MTTFDANGAALLDSGVFGMPYSEVESSLVLLPVPWEATCSCGTGTALAPEAILEASRYIDLYIPEYGNFYEAGIYFAEVESTISQLNTEACQYARTVIDAAGRLNSTNVIQAAEAVNNLSDQLNTLVYNEVKKRLSAGKKVGLVGGNHSVPLGAIRAYKELYPDMAVLQIDAHCDLIQSFEGFTYSHASIMYNAFEKININALVQVGIRALCEEEQRYIDAHQNITTFFNTDVRAAMYTGSKWVDICNDICKALPQNIYISFDIDGLNPALCPGTGTPVPGGLEYDEVVFLLNLLKNSGKNIIGFDLVEVSPKQYDANIAAFLLYRLCAICL